MGKVSIVLSLLFLASSGFANEAQLSCPESVSAKEAICMRQVGILSGSPSYDVDRLLSNCRTRKGGETATCRRNSLAECNVSAEVGEILNSGLDNYLEQGLDYLCSQSNLIEENRDCFENLSRQGVASYCFNSAARSIREIFDSDQPYNLDYMKASLCSFTDRVGECNRNATLTGCHNEDLANAMGNFWYSTNVEWCF